MNAYICLAYVMLFCACLAGAFSCLFEANLLQKLALAILAFWSVWRIGVVYEHGWGYPHEPVVATGFALYVVGSIWKTYKYHNLNKKLCDESLSQLDTARGTPAQ